MVVSVQVSVQAAVVVDLGGPLCAGETDGVELICVRLVVLFGGGAVDGEGVGLGGPTDCDADHRLGLEIGAVFVAVRVFVKVNTQKGGTTCACQGELGELVRMGW